MNLFSAQAQDSALAFFINQLTSFDQTIHQPLIDVTWGRDIDLRSTGVSLGQQSTSFTRNSYAGGGTLSALGQPWLANNATQMPNVTVDREFVTKPFRLLGRDITYSKYELEASRRAGIPLDVAELEAMQSMYQLSTDQLAYVGDADLNFRGLLNSLEVSVGNVAAGASLSTLWVNKTSDEIIRDISEGESQAWVNSATSIAPTRLLLPPEQFSYIVSQKVSSAGNVSILNYVKENSLANAKNGRPLEIYPVKWLTGRGVGGTNRMVFYTKQERLVRFPHQPIVRETPYFNKGLTYTAPYVWGTGEVEFVYPETVLYRDGI